MSTTDVARRTDAICPPWCAGHNEQGYQSWYAVTVGDREVEERTHADETVWVAHDGFSAGVEVTCLERENGLLDPRVTTLSEKVSGPADLTPEDARGLASLLVAAAERAEGRDAVGVVTNEELLKHLQDVNEVSRRQRERLAGLMERVEKLKAR